VLHPGVPPLYRSALEIMKLLFCFLFTGLFSRADLVRKEVPTVGNPEEKNIVWFREGVKIMTECPRKGQRSVLVTITPIDVERGRSALTISIKSGHISRMSGGPALLNCSFLISDFTEDGVPDLIQIFSRKGNPLGIKHALIEAYTITNDVVEPIPSEMLEANRSGFLMEDQNIVRFIQEKEAEQAGTGQPATRPESRPEGDDKPQPEAEGRSR
jgi:hypothetical protein